MKCSGYAVGSEELVELTEMMIEADADALRKLSQFLCQCADEIDAHGEDWEHEHFQDSSFSGSVAWSTDIIVVQSARKR